MVTSENLTTSSETLTAVKRFNSALNNRDFDELRASMTKDCIFEDTDPRPNGTRYIGRDLIVKYFRQMAEISPDSRFEVEEILTSGDRCIVLWDHLWKRGSIQGNNRGVDIFRIRAGKIAEKLAYTKNGESPL